jgi:branched-chain amino acid transport system ATP-binding protein
VTPEVRDGATQEAVLEVANLNTGYGDIQILYDVDLEVYARESVLVFGPNGAGKSTLMKAVFGLIPVWRGAVRFEGRSIAGWNPEDVVAAGISYVPQLENVFPSLTVEENLEIGGVLRRNGVAQRISELYDMFPPLSQARRRLAGTLSGGQRQMLAMARALMLEPHLLLLDEPSAGLAPILVEEIFEWVARINASGTTILMIEQNVQQVLPVVDRGYALEMGRNRLSASSEVLLADEEIGRLYLGA